MTNPEARYEVAVQGALDLQRRVFWLAWTCFVLGINLGIIETTSHTPWWLDMLVIMAAGLFLIRVAVPGAIYWPLIRARWQQRRLHRTR